jgi:beta-glucosidase
MDLHLHHKVTSSPEESAAMALNAGCDLNCGCTYPMLTVACKQGLVTEEAIDQALTRLFVTRLKLGMLGAPVKKAWAALDAGIINCEKHQKLALKAAEKSIVLLKNDDGLLPLDGSNKKVFVIGPSAANPLVLMGNYYGMSGNLVTILEGLTHKLSAAPGVQLEYKPGFLQYEANHAGWKVFEGQSILPDDVDVVIACFGLDGCIEGEEGDAVASDSNGDRDAIELPAWQISALRMIKACGKKVILVLTGGSAIAFPPELADAVLWAWYPGEQGGAAIAGIIAGSVNPSGKLPVTFPKSTADLPPYESYDMAGRTYRYMEKEPLFPFGFGLSYTRFRFDSIRLSGRTLASGGKIKAQVSVTNMGKAAGEEVVQIYIAKEQRTPGDPVCSLKAFRRVRIGALKQATVEIELPDTAFHTVDAAGEHILAPGVYVVTAAEAAPTDRAAALGAAKPVSAKVRVGKRG